MHDSVPLDCGWTIPHTVWTLSLILLHSPKQVHKSLWTLISYLNLFFLINKNRNSCQKWGLNSHHLMTIRTKFWCISHLKLNNYSQWNCGIKVHKRKHIQASSNYTMNYRIERAYFCYILTQLFFFFFLGPKTQLLIL